ncbi:MAG: hypothetical protein ACI8P3_000753 [Saprospiraceae bacterium]|jgi:hypothetical protein
MKKIYFLTMFLFSALLINAQTSVTFTVDMNTEGASGDGIFMSGNWMAAAGLGSDWQEPGSNMDAQLDDSDGDGIYTLTVSLAAGDYQYKFANGTGWPNAEAGGAADNYQANLSGCDGIDNGFGGFNRSVTIPNQASFSPDAYQFNSCDAAAVGVNDLTTIQEIKITPNPTSDIAVVSFSNVNNANHEVTLTNITGQVVKQYNNVSGTSLEIDAQMLTTGMYFVTFYNDLGELGTEKLIVR